MFSHILTAATISALAGLAFLAPAHPAEPAPARGGFDCVVLVPGGMELTPHGFRRGDGLLLLCSDTALVWAWREI